jgi:hypothetical protein
VRRTLRPYAPTHHVFSPLNRYTSRYSPQHRLLPIPAPIISPASPASPYPSKHTRKQQRSPHLPLFAFSLALQATSSVQPNQISRIIEMTKNTISSIQSSMPTSPSRSKERKSWGYTRYSWRGTHVVELREVGRVSSSCHVSFSESTSSTVCFFVVVAVSLICPCIPLARSLYPSSSHKTLAYLSLACC